MRKWLVTIVLLACLSGCATMNGVGADTENVGRWLKKATQPERDKLEMRAISAAIADQNRIMNRGNKLASSLR